MANPFDMKMNMFIRTIFMYLVGPKIVNMYMNHEVIKNLLNSNDKFDICIFEIFLVDSMLVGYFNMYNATDQKQNIF